MNVPTAISILAALCSPVTAMAQLCNLHIVAQDESGHRNQPNYFYDAQHTAGGHYQITDTNWRYYAPLVDVNIRKWPNALSAPEQIQGQVAGIMKAKLGCLPWAPYNPTLRRHLGITYNVPSPKPTVPSPPLPKTEIERIIMASRAEIKLIIARH